MKQEPFQNEILTRYAECGNGGIIAKELGITNYRVYKCLRENNIEPKKIGGKEKHPASVMKQMYESGMSTIQIGKELDMHPVSVWERLRNHGVMIRSQSEALEVCGHTLIKSNDESQVIELYQSGMSANEVASHLNLKRKDPVLRVLKKHGIECRDTCGPNNSNWQGGITPLHNYIRNCTKYTAFRAFIMKSRNYTCELCGQYGGTLNVHHLDHFASLLQEFIEQYQVDPAAFDNTEVDKCIHAFAPFWDESNIVLICEKDHKQLHSEEHREYRVTSNRAKQAVKLYISGKNKYFVYTLLKMSSHTLDQILTEHGVVLRPNCQDQIKPINPDKLRDLLMSQQLSARQAGKMCNVAHTTIKRKAKEIGILRKGRLWVEKL